MFCNIFLGYLTMTLAVFSLWFSLFLLDKTTPKNDLISWIVLLIAPWFWPIVLPLSIRELVVKITNKENCQDSIQV